MKRIHLGYEVGTGEAVSVPLNHLCVTGQTQMSGKTTTLEALISRSGLKAIAFVTKRGEGAFNFVPIDKGEGVYEHPTMPHGVKPFFREQAGWQFVSEILGAVLSEKLKFERSWIMKVSRGAKSLADVQRNVEAWLGKPKLRSLDESVLTTISEYFKLFMPELERLPYSSELSLRPGLNVMDLSSYSLPLQMLVISATVEEVYKHQSDVVVVIPEAWEFIPEGKSSPAKAAVIRLIRKGGNLKNFVWLDSQDIAGVEKEVIRQVPVWILGVQREQNEVARTLKHIPAGVKKPKAEQLMQLSKGQFIVCFEKEVKMVYVQPVWMTGELAQAVARGETSSMPSKPVATFELAQASPYCFYELDTREVKRIARNGLASYDSRPQSVIDQERKEIDRMDSLERQAYQDTIRSLEEQIKGLIEMSALGTATGVQAIMQVPDRRGPGSSGAALHQAVLTVKNILDSPPTLESLAKALLPYLPQGASSDAIKRGEQDGYIYASKITDQAMALIRRALLADDQFLGALAGLMPASGRVQIEPKEVVLRAFQEQEVKRVLAGFQSYSAWQKAIIRFLHAKGSNSNQVDIFRAVRGKGPNQLSGTERKEKQDELAALVTAGVLRKDDGGRFYPELEKMVKARLSPFHATDQDAEDVIGQVLLQLK